LKPEEVGSLQDDAIQNHKHSDNGHQHNILATYINTADCGNIHCGALIDVNRATGNRGGDTSANKADIGGVETFSGASGVKYSKSETRVKNSYVYWIIRVK